MVNQIVYRRSESTYENPNSLSIWEKLYEFDNFDDAKSELITNGKRLTEEFYNKYQQGCAFHIINVVSSDTESMDYYKWSWTHNGIHNLYNTNRIKGKTYVFSELSYQMVINEYRKYNKSTKRFIEYYKDEGIITDLPLDILKESLENNYLFKMNQQKEYLESFISKFEEILKETICTIEHSRINRYIKEKKENYENQIKIISTKYEYEKELLKYSFFVRYSMYDTWKGYVKIPENKDFFRNLNKIKFNFNYSTTEIGRILDIQGDKYVRILTNGTNCISTVGYYEDVLKEIIVVCKAFENYPQYLKIERLKEKKTH